jgi:DNA end-binding protein Ku
MRPIDNGIIMQVLHYADEVRPFSEIPVGDAVVKEPELKLAVQLIDQIATDEFHPESYVDDVRARYHEAIQRKVEGQEVTSAAAPEVPKGQIIDLMEALKASLAQKGPHAVPAAGRPAVEPAKPAKRAAAARTTEARTLRAPKAAAGGKRR